MRDSRYFLLFLILVVAQILLNDFLNLSQYLVLSILPMLILCLPIRFGTISTMIIAFLTGFAVDFFSSGMIGMTSLALVPLALMRRGIIVLVFGEEVYSRGENISMRRQGVLKMGLGILIASAVFFTILIAVDLAGTHSFWFFLLKLALSCLVSTIVSVFLSAQFDTD